MEVSISECPDCGAMVMEDQANCNECGKPLPRKEPTVDPKRSLATPEEVPCPKCGTKVPRSVLRCRDCGSYMSLEIEAAMLAKQMSRGFGNTGGTFGTFSTPASLATSSFAEVADDADFDLNPDVDLLDDDMQQMVDQQSHSTAVGGVDDDFETNVGDAGYAVAVPAEADVPAVPAVDEAPPTTGEAPPVDAAAPASPTAEASVPAVDHSVQTGGDVLLDAALAEERDAATRVRGGRRRLRRSTTTDLGPDRFLVFCPNGHRIQVHTKHRGRTGRCPNCRTLFFVPLPEASQTAGEAGEGAPAGDAAAAGAAAPAGSNYTRWITDVHLHRLNPAKLKLKPGSLAPEYEPIDLGASPEHLLLAVLFTGGGPFRAMQEPKKKAAAREAMLTHLNAKMPLPDLPIPKHYTLTTEQLQQLKISQPTVPGEESLFADIPVFGEGRIAIRIPAADQAGERAYLSFTLSQFREFSAMLAESFGLADFGSGTAIPMNDDWQEATCHYSDAVLKSLPPQGLVYYKADPKIKLIPVGRRCEKCGLVVSEDSRKKEKIGGTSDASIAKAKCPKCKQKFGSITLFGFPQA
jgi:hypothetical protein